MFMGENNIKNIISLFSDEIKLICKNNLTAIFLIGSAGKSKFINQWSDLDFCIVTNCVILEQFQEIEKKTLNYPVHIGLTFITAYELKSLKVPLRIMVSLYEFNQGLNKIIFAIEKNLIPQVNKNLITQNNNLELSLTIQKLRRNFARQTFKNLFKNLVLIKKLLLRNLGHVAYDLEEIDSLFYSYYNPNDIPLVQLFKLRDDNNAIAIIENNINILLNYIDSTNY